MTVLFHEMTRQQINAVAPRAIAVLPTAATEQHGPHMAVGTDTLLVTTVAQRAAQVAADTVPVIITPPLPFGSSHHHYPFGGTLYTIESSSQFSEYFVEVMWGNATALERLITLLMLDKPSFTLAQIETLLREHGVEVSSTTIGQALDGLVLCSILNREEQEYYFTAPAFPSVVTVTQDVESLVERTIQHLHSETVMA